MKRTLRVRQVVTRSVRLDAAPVATCDFCRRDVPAITREEACGILQLGGRALDALVADGRVHEIPTAGGTSRICRESLFPKRFIPLVLALLFLAGPWMAAAQTPYPVKSTFVGFTTRLGGPLVAGCEAGVTSCTLDANPFGFPDLAGTFTVSVPPSLGAATEADGATIGTGLVSLASPLSASARVEASFHPSLSDFYRSFWASATFGDQGSSTPPATIPDICHEQTSPVQTIPNSGTVTIGQTFFCNASELGARSGRVGVYVLMRTFVTNKYEDPPYSPKTEQYVVAEYRVEPDCSAITARGGAGPRALAGVCEIPPSVTSMDPGVVSNSARPGFQQDPIDVTIVGKEFDSDAVVKVKDVTVEATTYVDEHTLRVRLSGFRNVPAGDKAVTVTNVAEAVSGVTTGVFTVTSIEAQTPVVNQAVPLDCTLAAPCVADHPTVIRSEISCNGNGGGCPDRYVAGRLHVFDARSGAPVPGSPFESRVAPSAPLEPTLSNALEFALTGSRKLDTGEYELALEIDPANPDASPAGDHVDSTRNLVRRRTGLTFRDSAAPLVLSLLLDVNPVSTELVRDLVQSLRYLEGVYPASGRTVSTELVPFRLRPNVASADFLRYFSDLQELLVQLRDVSFLHPATAVFAVNAGLKPIQDASAAETDGPGQSGLDVGGVSLCQGDRNAGTYGCGYSISLLDVALERPTLAHHLAHHLSFGDTYFRAPSSRPIGPSPKNPPCGPAEGCRVERGHVDVVRQVPPFDGTFGNDFMGLGSFTTWTDRRTWDSLYGLLFAPPPPTRRPLAAVELVTLSGVVRADGGSLGRLLRTRGTPLAPSPGDFAIELRDASGGLLSSTSFEPASRLGAVEFTTERPFTMTVPLAPGMARVVLVHGATVLAERTFSTHAPTVTVVSPNGGESLGGTVPVTWTAADADGDPLTFDVFYASDGVTFLPIALGVTGTRLDWDAALAAGSSKGRIKVVASDGALSASDVSDADFTLAKKAPMLSVTAPSDGATFLAGTSVTFDAVAFDVEDGVLESSAFEVRSDRDGLLGNGAPLAASRLSAGAHVVTITARDSDGNNVSGTVRIHVFDRPASAPPALHVPIVLSTAGVGGSFFGSELTLTNRGATDATAELAYTPAFGGGAPGAGLVFLPAGRQLVVPDALASLVSLGVPLTPVGNRGGTLAVRFFGASSEDAGAALVRTTSVVPGGRAGLSYPGVRHALTGPVTISGLRQDGEDRSNVAVQNAGGAEAGTVVLRLTVHSGDPANLVSKALPDVGLAPGAFAQFSGVLGLEGLSLTNGYVTVERISGTAPYYAYGVVNDQGTSDGSFVPPFPPGALAGKTGMTVPVVVETPVFTSELVATNASTQARRVRLALVADAVSSADHTATITLELAPHEQRVVPSFVQFLRDQHVAGVGAAGPAFAGSLFVTADSGDLEGILVGVRTSSASAEGKGRFGLFYTGVPFGAAASSSAWVYGLQQNAENRSNLAIVNTGDVDGSGSAYRVEIYDGATGRLAKTLETSLAARRFVQLSGVLSANAPGVTQGYAKITRLSGNNQFLAYGVINDGGAPGQRTGDGAFVAMEVEAP